MKFVKYGKISNHLTLFGFSVVINKQLNKDSMQKSSKYIIFGQCLYRLEISWELARGLIALEIDSFNDVVCRKRNVTCNVIGSSITQTNHIVCRITFPHKLRHVLI